MKKQGLEIILITNTVYPYLKHNIPVLSLPYGLSYRFRYERKHFEMRNVEELEGKEGLLVLRHFERGTFIPLRTFRCFRVEPFGNFIFLELQFLNYVKYEWKQDLDGTEQEREKYNKDISNVMVARGISNIPRIDIDKLIVSTSPQSLNNITIDDRSNFECTVRCWSNIVTLLGGIDSYRKICFYLIAAIRNVDSGKEVTLFESKQRKGLNLNDDKTYVLQVFQMMASKASPPPPSFNIELQHIPQHILALRNSEVVDGPYDRMEFYFYVFPQDMRRLDSFMIIESKQLMGNPEDEREAHSVPPSFMLTKIGWTRWKFFRKKVLPIVVAIIGSVVFYLSKEFASALSNLIGVEVKPEVAQLVAFMLFAWAAGNLTSFTGAFKAPIGPKT